MTSLSVIELENFIKVCELKRQRDGKHTKIPLRLIRKDWRYTSHRIRLGVKGGPIGDVIDVREKGPRFIIDAVFQCDQALRYFKRKLKEKQG